MKSRKKVLSIEKKQQRYGYLFCLPFVIGFLWLVAYPLVMVVIFSFNDLSVGSVTYELTGVGLDHYKTIFLVDPNFRKTVFNSLGDMLINVPVVVLFSFFIASILNQKFLGRTAFRTILFLPVILASGLILSLTQLDFLTSSMSTAGTMSEGGMFSGSFSEILQGMNVDQGIVRFIEGLVDRISEITTMAAVPSVIFLSGMQSISPSIFEASYIEGATSWDVFWKVSFPMVSPLILVNIIYCIVDSFTSYSNAAIQTIHEQLFGKVQYGLGSAMALVYLVLVSVIIAVVYLVVRRLIYYYDA